jgi:hypothetical protein
MHDPLESPSQLNVLDEFSHECLAIRVARQLSPIS